MNGMQRQGVIRCLLVRWQRSAFIHEVLSLIALRAFIPQLVLTWQSCRSTRNPEDKLFKIELKVLLCKKRAKNEALEQDRPKHIHKA